jgi:hypothetical protein
MNDFMTGSRMLIGELILYNAVKDIYFTSMTKLNKVNNQSFKKID